MNFQVLAFMLSGIRCNELLRKREATNNGNEIIVDIEDKDKTQYLEANFDQGQCHKKLMKFENKFFLFY